MAFFVYSETIGLHCDHKSFFNKLLFPSLKQQLAASWLFDLFTLQTDGPSGHSEHQRPRIVNADRRCEWYIFLTSHPGPNSKNNFYVKRTSFMNFICDLVFLFLNLYI